MSDHLQRELLSSTNCLQVFRPTSGVTVLGLEFYAAVYRAVAGCFERVGRDQ